MNEPTEPVTRPEGDDDELSADTDEPTVEAGSVTTTVERYYATVLLPDTVQAQLLLSEGETGPGQPEVAGAILREPWATLLAADFQAQMDRAQPPPSVILLVEV
jgi:hypothetical protein